MLEFELIDDTENIELTLENNEQALDLTLTDYNDSEVRELIDDVDNKIDELETKTDNEFNQLSGAIENLQANKADKTQVNSLASQVSANTTQISQNKADINTLNTKVDNIHTPTKTSELTNDSGFISDDNYVHTDNNYTTTEKNKLAELRNYDDTQIKEDISNLQNNKQDKLVSGSNIKTVNNQSLLGSGNIEIQGGGSSDYEELENLPKVNNVELKGNKSLNDLGIQPEGNYALSSDIPTQLSQLTEDTTHKLVTDAEKTTWNGKQNQITSSNKLASNLIDDTNQTNKFVTDVEKQTWNNKSNFSGAYADLTGKPVMSYTDTEIENKVVTQVTRTKTIESTHDNLYYGTYHFIPLNMSSYTSSTGSKALKPEDYLPAGRYVVTNSGYIRLGSTAYKLDPGTFIFWDGSELNLIGYNACEYWSYYEGEWEGGYFTTQVDVESMLEDAVISTVIHSGNFNVESKDNGYYLFNYSASSGTGKRLSINVEGTSTHYYPYNGTILIKNDRYVVMLGRENLIFEYDSTNDYYKEPIDLTTINSRLSAIELRLTALES